MLTSQLHYIDLINIRNKNGWRVEEEEEIATNISYAHIVSNALLFYYLP